MKTIKTILFITLFGIFATIGYSQESAQATMKVSVTVVKGVSTQVNPVSGLVFDRDGVKGELGSIELAGVDNHEEMVISTQNVLNLYNEEGNRVEIPVEMKKKFDSNNVNLQFITDKEKDTGENFTGYYTGSLTTQIEYL